MPHPMLRRVMRAVRVLPALLVVTALPVAHAQTQTQTQTQTQDAAGGVPVQDGDMLWQTAPGAATLAGMEEMIRQLPEEQARIRAALDAAEADAEPAPADF